MNSCYNAKIHRIRTLRRSVPDKLEAQKRRNLPEYGKENHVSRSEKTQSENKLHQFT